MKLFSPKRLADMIKGSLNVNVQTLNLPLTLTTGQNFRWKKCSNQNEWIGVIDNRFVVTLSQDPDKIDYKILNTDQILNELNSTSTESVEKIHKYFRNSLESYFSLDIDIDNLYSTWSRQDKNFSRISSNFKGIRLLRQNVCENIFSFICSSNNNISRITKMIETLCNQYGTKLYSSEDNIICSFPSMQTLSLDNVENELRNFGFGSKFINKTAKQIIKLSDGECDRWLNNLRNLSYEDAKQELMTLPGIGAKVADCICLMSLGFSQAVPVDTHVYQITARHYLSCLKTTKTLTAKQYQQIGDFYREKFKPHAGWAQTVLFCSDLRLRN